MTDLDNFVSMAATLVEEWRIKSTDHTMSHAHTDGVFGQRIRPSHKIDEYDTQSSVVNLAIQLDCES